MQMVERSDKDFSGKDETLKIKHFTLQDILKKHEGEDAPSILAQRISLPELKFLGKILSAADEIRESPDGGVLSGICADLGLRFSMFAELIEKHKRKPTAMIVIDYVE